MSEQLLTYGSKRCHFMAQVSKVAATSPCAICALLNRQYKVQMLSCRHHKERGHPAVKMEPLIIKLRMILRHPPVNLQALRITVSKPNWALRQSAGVPPFLTGTSEDGSQP